MQPPASLKALADPIYEAFYGLSDQPFAITTDPKFFYLSASHQLAFSELLNGLRRREGLLLLTGETGTGKTTLCRTVLESLGQRTFSAIILNPYMSGPEVFRIVLRDFGLVSHEELRRGALATADVPQLVDTLEGFLRSLVPLESHAVIVLDEAQSLSPVVLDQIRLLTALEEGNRRLVQVVLCGQPALLETLKTEPMLALNERITRRVTLAPLQAGEVDAYIQHRIAVAGGTHTVRFDAPATTIVAELAHGLPRRINVLCDRALQEGRVDGVTVITPDLVKRAARSLAGAHDQSPVPAEAPAPAPPSTPQPPDAATPAPPAEPVVEHPTPRAAALGPTLTFGQEATPQAGRFRRVWMAIGAMALVGLLGAAYYAYGIVRAGEDGPVAPAAPVLDIGTPAGPLPAPPPEDFGRLFNAPAPRPEPPQPQPPPPPAPASGQLPGDPNQLN